MSQPHSRRPQQPPTAGRYPPQNSGPRGGGGRVREVTLITNSFEIKRLPTETFSQYDIVIQPPIEAKFVQKRLRLMDRLVKVLYPHIFDKLLVYDGNAIAYSPQRLNLGSGGAGGRFLVDFYSPSGTTLTPGARGVYTVIISLTAGQEIKPSEVVNFYRNNDTTRATIATNLIQNIIRQAPNQHVTSKGGQAYFDLLRGKRDDGGLGIYFLRGIFQSVRPTIGRMVINVDTCTAAVYRDGPLYSVALDFLRTERYTPNTRDLELSETSQNFKKLENFLKKVQIKIQTGDKNNKTRTIRGLVPYGGEYVFTKDGSETTVARHFSEAYGIHLRHPRSFGVLISPRNAPMQVVVPGELCNIEPGQLFKKKIPDTLTAKMVKFSAIKPGERFSTIRDAVKIYDNDYVMDSGMQVSKMPMQVNAKILNVPHIFFNTRGGALPVRSGAWNVVGQVFNEPKPLHYWLVVNFAHSLTDIRSPLENLVRSCQKLGMDPTPTPGFTSRGMPQDPVGSMESIMTKARESLGAEKFGRILRELVILVILPENGGHIKTLVKHWGDVKCGIITQCLREGKVKRANDQYWNNIALKLNARLGGKNFITNSESLQYLLSQGPYMIMGADVGHPGPGMQKPSVTSIVFSHDQHATQYAAFTGIQAPRTEMIEDLVLYVKSAIKLFSMKNNSLPTRLIFFRDGLSEGEYSKVAEAEILNIKRAFDDLRQEYKGPFVEPLLTFIVVGKRHHAIFMPLDQDLQNQDRADTRTGNALPGSLIEEGITRPHRVYRDFYLQSHAAIQGTSRSSHYIVICDDIWGFKGLNMIQDLAFTLCHVYAKATRSVSIPAPVYYADLVCTRGAYHIDPNASLYFDDNSSIASGSSNTMFNLDAWRSAFAPVNPSNNFDKSMYFL